MTNMASLSKLLKCTKLFGGDCEFVHKAKTIDEIMHVFSGHLAEEHGELAKKFSKEELRKKVEENIEEV